MHPQKNTHLQSLLTKLVMGSDPGRQMNLKITLSAQPAYLANLALIWYCVHNGLMDPELRWPISWSVLASMAFFYVAIRFGWSRRLRDPAMTVPQMMAATLLSAVGYVVAPQVHILLLMPVAVTMAYSVFALKGRAVVFMQLFNMAVFSLTSIVMCYRQPQYYKPEVEVLVLSILATTVVVLTWSGSQIAELRARHRRQREELTQTLARIADLATRDALTGLSNRRHMNTLLAHHVERARRFGPPLTLAMVDLDYFKRVNDTHGHAVGDHVLQTFAHVAQNALRGSDTLARWGGEEFLLMSTASQQDVLALLEQVRAQLADTPASTQVPTLRVGFSAGIATHHHGEDVQNTIHRADEALYEAKTAGRAQTRLAAEAAPNGVNASAQPAATVPATASNVAVTAKELNAQAPELKIAGVKHSVVAGDISQAISVSQTPATVIAVGRLAWLLGRDDALRRMLLRMLMGYVPYLAGLIILGYAAHMNLMSVPLTQSLALGLFLTPVLMFAAVRSGLTRKLKDPALTLPQILLATTWTAVMSDILIRAEFSMAPQTSE